MNNPPVKVSSILTLLITLTLCVQCSSKDKSNNTQTTTTDPTKALTAVIDSVNLEIKAGNYGLIDHFMLIKDEQVLANFRYQQDYETVAQNYDTTDHQYNYHHPKWHPYYQYTDLHSLQSVTKSITSILMGIALEQNKEYSIETKLMNLLPNYKVENADKRLYEITIEDLLTMRASFKWNEGKYDDMTDDCVAMEAEDDWIQFVLEKPFDSNPGEKWEYNSGVSVLIGKLVKIISGKSADKLAEESLFGPMGIEEYYWKKTPLGEVDTEGGLYLKTEDFAKFGKLFLDNGVWNGQQIVPQSWVIESVKPKATNLFPEEEVNVGYGYQWWTEDYDNGTIQIFTANGYGGQYLMVVPKHNLYIVFNGWNTDVQPEQSTFFVLVNRIMPAILDSK